jgi:hypothetical protein
MKTESIWKVELRRDEKQCEDVQTNVIEQSLDERYKMIPNWSVNERQLLESQGVAKKIEFNSE